MHVSSMPNCRVANQQQAFNIAVKQVEHFDALSNSYGQFEIKVLKRDIKQAALLAIWTSAGSLLHTVGVAILKARVPHTCQFVISVHDKRVLTTNEMLQSV